MFVVIILFEKTGERKKVWEGMSELACCLR